MGGTLHFDYENRPNENRNHMHAAYMHRQRQFQETSVSTETTVYTPFLCAMHARQKRYRSTRGPITRGKHFPHGPTAEDIARICRGSINRRVACAPSQNWARQSPGACTTYKRTGASMTGTHVKPKRQITTPLGRKQRKQVAPGLGSGTPPQVGGSGGILPCCTCHAPSRAKRPEGQSGLSHGALTYRKGASAKKS